MSETTPSSRGDRDPYVRYFKLRPPEGTEAVLVPITYSSVVEHGRLAPSRLSTLSYLTALAIAQMQPERERPAIVMAGEQSYREDPRTTGDLLVARFNNVPLSHDVTVLRDEETRLLNTTYQMAALVTYFSTAGNEDKYPYFVGFGYHLPRVRRNLHRAGIVIGDNQQFSVNTVLGLMEQFDHNSMTAILGRTRFEPDIMWSAIEQRMRRLSRRERITSIADRLYLINLLTQLRGKGRFDQLTAHGKPILKTTS